MNLTLSLIFFNRERNFRNLTLSRSTISLTRSIFRNRIEPPEINNVNQQSNNRTSRINNRTSLFAILSVSSSLIVLVLSVAHLLSFIFCKAFEPHHQLLLNGYRRWSIQVC